MPWKPCCIALTLLLSFAAQSETNLSQSEVDALAAQPGTEVIRTQDGNVQITEIRRAGVNSSG